MTVGLLRRHIQHFFWLEIFDMIGGAGKAYSDALQAAVHKPPEFERTQIQALSLDRTELNKNPETQAEIAKQDTLVATLKAELADDESRFQDKVDTIIEHYSGLA